MKLLEVYINNEKIINEKEILLNNSQAQPKIKFSKDPTKKYTIIMLDPDAPVSKINGKAFLHWLVINDDTEIVPFKPPTPPKGSGLHKYYIYLFEQPKDKIKIEKILDKSNFDLTSFIKMYKLKPISYVMFKTKHPED